MNHIAFLSGVAGSGRTIISVAIATYFAENGLVAFVDFTETSQYYWHIKLGKGGDGYSTVGNRRYSPHLSHVINFDNIHIFTPVEWDKLTDERKVKYNTVIYNCNSLNNLTSDGFTKKVVVVHLNNHRSIINSFKVANEAQRRKDVSFVYPLMNMDCGISEHDKGTEWDNEEWIYFKTYFHIVFGKDAESKRFAYHVPFIPFLAFDHINPAAWFNKNDHIFPGYRLHNLYKLLK